MASVLGKTLLYLEDDLTLWVVPPRCGSHSFQRALRTKGGRYWHPEADIALKPARVRAVFRNPATRLRSALNHSFGYLGPRAVITTKMVEDRILAGDMHFRQQTQMHAALPVPVDKYYILGEDTWEPIPVLNQSDGPGRTIASYRALNFQGIMDTHYAEDQTAYLTILGLDRSK